MHITLLDVGVGVAVMAGMTFADVVAHLSGGCLVQGAHRRSRGTINVKRDRDYELGPDEPCPGCAQVGAPVHCNTVVNTAGYGIVVGDEW